jgi:hypothetical protein
MNQQLEFELDNIGQRMFVGSNNEGLARVYNVLSRRLEGTQDVFGDDAMADAGKGRGTMKRRDAVNGLFYFCNISGGGGA